MEKPSTPKGFRDFSPSEMVKRNYIFSVIKEKFQLYGFQPIETPSMEKLSTLTGKYGEEGDKLLFKVLNSGNFLEGLENELTETSAKSLAFKICEKGLRYDLTVPFARYVVEHYNDITFPFRRYQIQPVWRADRPQKGRYREFYQCDADVIGSNSLLNEAELIYLTFDIFNAFRIPVKIKINNRKILLGLAESVGISEKFTDMTIALDKLDKSGMDGVMKELNEKGFGADSIRQVINFLSIEGTNLQKLQTLKSHLHQSPMGLKGIEELTETLERSKSAEECIEFDQSLARGLNYYTGAIFEVKTTAVQIGSLAGGGRYDDLTGIFGMPGMSGVGISYGAERIFDVLEELHLFPENLFVAAKVMIVNFGGEEEKYAAHLAKELRAAGISTILYPEAAKLKKQFSFADSVGIPYVIIAGSQEIQEGKITLKNMKTGEQEQKSEETALLLLKHI